MSGGAGAKLSELIQQPRNGFVRRSKSQTRTLLKDKNNEELNPWRLNFGPKISLEVKF